MALRDNAWDLVAVVRGDLPFGAYYDVAVAVEDEPLDDDSFVDEWSETAVGLPPTNPPTLPETPGSASAVRRFGINSSLADPVDSFDIDVADVEWFTDPDALLRLRLSVGLLDADDAEQLIAQLRQGELFDMRLAGDAISRQLSVRGLDAAAAMVRQRINKHYLLRHPGTSPPTPSIGTAGTGTYIAPSPEFSYGQLRASQIAADLASRAGLTLAWGCRDYLMREDFAATGRLIDVLARLIEPWCLAEPTRVDVYVRNQVLIVKERPSSPTATYTHTIAASRVSNLSIERAELSTVGDVLLFGRRRATALTPTGGGGFSGGTVTLTRVDETRDRAGRLTSMVETTETFRMPDRLLIASDRRTYTRKSGPGENMVVTAKEVVTIDFEPTTYGPNGPLNQPLENHHVVETYAATTRDATLRLKERATTDFAYDSNRFLRAITTITEKYNRARARLLPTDSEVVTYQDAAWGQVEQATCRYRFDSRGNPILQSRQTQFNAGYRVGGPRPPGSGPDTDNGHMAPIWAHVVVSTDDDAVDVQYSNPHMDAPDLQYIRERLAAASGLFRYTLAFSGPVMPWLRKGVYLELTDYVDHDGEPITLAPALVTDVRIDFDAGDNPGSVAAVTAVFWRAT